LRQWCRDCVCGAERELVLPLGIGEVVGRERATEKGQTVLREWARSLEGVGQQVGGGRGKKKDVSRLNLSRDESKREADQVGRKKFAEKPWLPASSAIETKGKRRAPLIALLCSLEKKKEEEKKPSS